MDKLGIPTSDSPSIDLNLSDGSDHDDHDHTGDFGSNGDATIIADSDFDRPTTAPVSIEEVEEIAFECVRLLDAVGSSKGIGADSLNVSVASRKSKGVASGANGSSSNGGSLDDDGHDDPGSIPSKGLVKSSKGIGVDSLNVSVASRKSKGVASGANGSSSNGGSLDDDGHDDPGSIPSKGLVKDGRVSFFLLAYIARA